MTEIPKEKRPRRRKVRWILLLLGLVGVVLSIGYIMSVLYERADDHETQWDPEAYRKWEASRRQMNEGERINFEKRCLDIGSRLHELTGIEEWKDPLFFSTVMRKTAISECKSTCHLSSKAEYGNHTVFVGKKEFNFNSPNTECDLLISLHDFHVWRVKCKYRDKNCEPKVAVPAREKQWISQLAAAAIDVDFNEASPAEIVASDAPGTIYSVKMGKPGKRSRQHTALAHLDQCRRIVSLTFKYTAPRIAGAVRIREEKQDSVPNDVCFKYRDTKIKFARPKDLVEAGHTDQPPFDSMSKIIADDSDNQRRYFYVVEYSTFISGKEHECYLWQPPSDRREGYYAHSEAAKCYDPIIPVDAETGEVLFVPEFLHDPSCGPDGLPPKSKDSESQEATP